MKAQAHAVAFRILVFAACWSVAGMSAQTGNADRTLLVFEIDEGMPGGLTDAHGQDPDATMARGLERIHRSLAELTDAYDVAVLVYPTHLYDRGAYHEPGATPIDAIHPRLLDLLRFFHARREEHPIKVMLEIYSSGVGTNQNGELARKAKPPLFARGADERDGLAMDLDAAEALARRWPDTLLGLRFHETLGSDVVKHAVGWRGFYFDPELVRAVIDLCKRRELLLLWSDPHWLAQEPREGSYDTLVYDPDHKPYIEREPFRSLLREARDKLGKNVCFSWANNSFHTTWNLQYLDVSVKPSEGTPARPIAEYILFDQPYTAFPPKAWPESRWGMSVQPWFWHELAYTLNGRYFMLGELLCPVEIIGAYVRKGLRERAAVIQFEPVSYFFNMQTWYARDHGAGHEGTPDYSERIDLVRLKRWLLDANDPTAPPDRLEAFFDRDQRRYHENDIAEPPHNYSQATLGLIGASGRMWCYDSYVDGRTLLPDATPRFAGPVFAGDVVATVRGELNGDGIDDLAVVKREAGGGLVLELYNAKSGLLYRDPGIVADTEDGTFYALASLNLVARKVGSCDPDELLVLRRHPETGRLHPRVYQIAAFAENGIAFSVAPVPHDVQAELVASFLPAEPQLADDVVAVAGQRTGSVLYTDQTRPLDRLLVFTRQRTALTVDSGQVQRMAVPPAAGRVLLDINHDRNDELCLLTRHGNEGRLHVHAVGDGGLRELATYTMGTLPPGVAGPLPPHLLGLRCSLLVNSKR